MINLLLLIPIFGSIILLPMREESNQLKMKQIALTTSLINFFISLFMWYQFDSNITQFQFVTEFNHLNLYHLNFGVDSISLYFVLLTTFVTNQFWASCPHVALGSEPSEMPITSPCEALSVLGRWTLFSYPCRILDV